MCDGNNGLADYPVSFEPCPATGRGAGCPAGKITIQLKEIESDRQ